MPETKITLKPKAGLDQNKGGVVVHAKRRVAKTTDTMEVVKSHKNEEKQRGKTTTRKPAESKAEPRKTEAAKPETVKVEETKVVSKEVITPEINPEVKTETTKPEAAKAEESKALTAEEKAEQERIARLQEIVNRNLGLTKPEPKAKEAKEPKEGQGRDGNNNRRGNRDNNRDGNRESTNRDNNRRSGQGQGQRNEARSEDGETKNTRDNNRNNRNGQANARNNNDERKVAPAPMSNSNNDKKQDKKGKKGNDRDFESGNANANKKSAGKGAKSTRVQQYSSHSIGDDEEYGSYSSMYDEHRGSKRRSGKGQKSKIKQNFTKPTTPVTRDVIIGETITVAELSNRMAVKAADIVKYFMNLGEMVTINQILPQETAALVAEDMGHKVILRNDNELELELLNENSTQQAAGELRPRAPVVTIMGHVDHGKTSLLDYIRKTRVAAGEAGGITQHIGAYHVTLASGREITFLDTPGHAAFTNMRARGAKVTDIVILVVAADDGVMPQTVEAIQHARAAGVPIIVACNKIDKPEANPERVRQELLQHGVIAEEFGGNEIFVNVSAKQGINVEELLETIALQAEVLELQATDQGLATGVVIESFLDRGRGPVATVLIQNGTLRKGDIVLCGLEYGKVRAMRNELGQNLDSAGPSIPVEILGLSGVPSAGDEVTVVTDERKAREVSNYRQGKFKEIKLARQQKSKLENLFAAKDANKAVELNIVLKADVQGSVEAICDALNKLATDEVKVNILASGVGGISETDATLALASNAIIIGFNVRADATARSLIERENIDLRYYSIIYDLINEVKAAMSGMLEPEYRHTIIGLAEVRDVFRSPKFGAVAGCMVTEGVVKRNNPIRVLRDNVVIYEGELESLRRFKDDVAEVRNGTECGIGVRNYNDVRVGDQIEVYEVEKIQRTI